MAGQSEQFSSSSVAPLDAVSKVELSISCTNLKDMDVFSKSDPIVFLYEKRGREWQKIGRTEVIDNNLNPKVSPELHHSDREGEGLWGVSVLPFFPFLFLYTVFEDICG